MGSLPLRGGDVNASGVPVLGVSVSAASIARSVFLIKNRLILQITKIQ